MQNPPPFLLILGVLLLVPPAIRSDAQDNVHTLKEALKGANSVTIKETDLPAEARQKLTAALGNEASVAAKVTLAVAAGLNNPLDDSENLSKAYAIAAAAGAAKVVVVAYPDSYQGDRLAVAAVRILAPAAPSAGLKRFVERFNWKTLGANGWESSAAFEALRKAAAAGADETAKQNKLLLDLSRDMQVMEYLRDLIKTGPDAAVPGAAGTLLKKYEETHAMYERSGFAIGGSADKQKKEIAILLAQNQKGIDEAKALKAAAAGDVAKARRAAGALSCAKCHGLYMKPFQKLRTERMIGNGYFIPGHDLPAVDDADAAAAKDVAAAVRKAMLLIELTTK
jgi:hypothetical protein